MKIRFSLLCALVLASCCMGAVAQTSNAPKAATPATSATAPNAAVAPKSSVLAPATLAPAAGAPAATPAGAPVVAPVAAASSKTGLLKSASGAPSVPDAFRSITLGSSLDAVKALLLADTLFGYRGERDVSLLPGENRSLIETSGPSFIKRAWFQFSEDKLYIMTLSLDPEKIDYYSVYSHLVEKYGEPTSLDPRKAVWGDDKATLSLERPLTVKYTDAEIFKKLLESDTTGKAASDIAREGFINEF